MFIGELTFDISILNTVGKDNKITLLKYSLVISTSVQFLVCGLSEESLHVCAPLNVWRGQEPPSDTPNSPQEGVKHNLRHLYHEVSITRELEAE